MEQHRIVALLPDEDQVGGRHEVRDELAAGRGTWERIGANAKPAFVVVDSLVGPELLLDDPLVPELRHVPMLGTLDQVGAEVAKLAAVRELPVGLAYGVEPEFRCELRDGREAVAPDQLRARAEP
jgi:hypothetical protein